MPLTRRRHRLVAALSGVAIAAVTATLGAHPGSAVSAPAVSPQQNTLEVLGSSISFQQFIPGGPVSGWKADPVVTLRVSGLPEGTFVESRLVIPGFPDEQMLPTFVAQGGVLTINTAYAMRRGTLKAAKAEAARVTVATVEVRVAADGPLLSRQVTSWMRYEPLALRNVKMKKSNAGAVFTGRLVTESGRPIRQGTGFVTIVQFTPAGIGDIVLANPGANVRPNGSFTVATTRRPQSGTIGVWGHLNVPLSGPFGQVIGSTYSKPFAFRP